MIDNTLSTAANRLHDWICNAALPLWSNIGIDSDSGAVVERLNAAGTPDLQANRRVRVQARQMFVFSLAAHYQWLSNAEQYINNIERFVQRHAQHPQDQSVYVHLLSANNEIIDAKQDTYDLAFFLLANAWRYRVFQDTDALSKAETLFAYIDKHFKSPHGGWLEGNYATDYRRQNPHMHLFEAFLALYTASNNQKWLERANEVFALFEAHFYDPDQQILLEYFTDDWQPLDKDGETIVEPGHMFEWVWLLQQYSRVSGTDVRQYSESLYQQALSIGMESSSGLIFDEINPSGKIIKGSKRCWPMTELIKANIALASTGKQECESHAAAAIDTLFKYYLSTPIAGSYIDRLDDDNNVINDSAPASTLYHLIVAAAEVIDYCNAKSTA